MFSSEYFELLKEILKSWHVIAVSIALVIYLYIVSYVARSYHRPRVKRVKIKKRPEKAMEAGPEETEVGGDSNDELGLEEA